MESIFLQLLNMSITASWIALAVIALRFLLKKAPKWIMGLLWGLVALRLICPFSFESILSLIPSAETVPTDIIISEAPAINSGIQFVNHAVNPVISGSLAPNVADSVNPLQVITLIASVVWLVGIAVMLVYTAISYIRLRLKVREAIKADNGAWLCDSIATPFILGIFRPKIYLPSSMNEADISYVLSHEKAHLKRRDYIWKPLGFLLLTVYWFNPVLWVAYILLCRDIELACDEKVIRNSGEDIKRPYSEALINCSVPRRTISACPLAFGEVGVKGRIKSVLSYRKPAFWIIIVAVVACIVTAVCLLTNPVKADTENLTLSDSMTEFVCKAIADKNTLRDASNFAAVDIRVIGTEKRGNQTKLYLWVMYVEYSYLNEVLKHEQSFNTPAVITVKETDREVYRLCDYWIPRDGAYYSKDIEAKFPKNIYDKAFYTQWSIEEQAASCLEKAQKHYGIPIHNSVGADYDNYTYNYMESTVSLSRKDNSFLFTYTDFSGYIAVGTYELTADRLTLTSDDGKHTYVFKLRNDTLVFDASQSSDIPKFFNPYGTGEQFSVPDGAVFEKRSHPPYYDIIIADIDNDGTEENCVLGFGPTSGVFTFTFIASVDGEVKYDSFYYSEPLDLSFVKEDNTVYVRGKTQDGETHLFAISVSDGRIILGENGEPSENGEPILFGDFKAERYDGS